VSNTILPPTQTSDLFYEFSLLHVYHQILISHFLPGGKRLLGSGFTFQEDNDPKHASKLCKGYLDSKENDGL
jgi:hypothetical protein